MGALGRLRTQQGNGLAYWCPGCEETHSIRYGTGPGPHWTWNGSGDKPTFHPSIRVSSGHFVDGWVPGSACWCTYNAAHPDIEPSFVCENCHVWIVDGVIDFLNDCTHKLKGQKVQLPMHPSNEAGMSDDKQKTERLSRYLLKADPEWCLAPGLTLLHWCPGCNQAHPINVEGKNLQGAIWSWNGIPDNPEFSPSINMPGRCHYFIHRPRDPADPNKVIAGPSVIAYCGDSSHALKGQTVQLPDFPEDW